MTFADCCKQVTGYMGVFFYAQNCGFLNVCFLKFSLVKFQVSSQIKTGSHSLKTTPAGGETNWHRNKPLRSTFLCSHCGNVQLAKDSTIHLSAFMQRFSSTRDHSLSSSRIKYIYLKKQKQTIYTYTHTIYIYIYPSAA